MSWVHGGSVVVQGGSCRPKQTAKLRPFLVSLLLTYINLGICQVTRQSTKATVSLDRTKPPLSSLPDRPVPPPREERRVYDNSRANHGGPSNPAPDYDRRQNDGYSGDRREREWDRGGDERDYKRGRYEVSLGRRSDS